MNNLVYNFKGKNESAAKFGENPIVGFDGAKAKAELIMKQTRKKCIINRVLERIETTENGTEYVYSFDIYEVL